MKKFAVKNISIEWRFKLKDQIRENFSNRQWADLTQKIVDTSIKRLIDKGLSPVAGQRMFQKYKNPEKYPGDLKSQNKPNLRLSGSMLSNYQAKATSEQMAITLGIHQDVNEEDRIKAKANNEGTETRLSKLAREDLKNRKKNPIDYSQMTAEQRKKEKRLQRGLKQASKNLLKGIVARRFVPLSGETYTRQILLEIRKAFAYCLKQALQRGRNK